jgi:hypothetical protein
VRDCKHCTALLYPLINTDLWALTTYVCLCLYLYACIFYVAYVRTIGNSPYFPLDYNIGSVAGSSEPGHAEVYIDVNPTRHT